MAKYERMISDSDGSLNLYTPGSLTPVLVRKNYARATRNINSSRAFASTLRAGPCAWPGGYEFVFVCHDGASLCFDCAHKNASLIMRATHARDMSGEHVTGMFLAGHDTDSRIVCDTCGKVIQEDWQDTD